MNKIQKIAIILFILLLNILILSISQTYPISITLIQSTFFQIPIYFWLIVFISPFLLYVIAKFSKNKIVPILCAMFYYFLFFSYGLYFVSHPTLSDIGSSTLSHEFISTLTHIGSSETIVFSYFQWPIHYIFSKMFSTLLNTTPILTLNLGFMSLISILPVFIILFYKSKNNFEKISSYFIVPAIYLTLGFFFINDQFVPQFLALIFLVILFGCYARYRETKSRLFFVLIILFYALTVFSHPFMFIFFLIAILFEKIWMEYVEKLKAKFISYELIIILFIIPFVHITSYLEEFRHSTFSESGRIFGYILSERTLSEGLQIQPLYHLVPGIYNTLFSFLAKGILIIAFVIVVVGFLIYYIKKKEAIDLGIIIGSFIWFLMGFSRMVLGQRALQVTPLALSSHFKQPQKIFSYLSKIIIVIILIAPCLFILNTQLNESLEGERLIQDNKENIAGKFLENHLDTNNSYIISLAQNAYPANVNSEIIEEDMSIISNQSKFQTLDFVIYSPKFKLRNMYFNIALARNLEESVMYSSKDIEIISIWGNRE